MRQSILATFVLLGALVFAPISLPAQEVETDFISQIYAAPAAAEKIGLAKLTASEKAALNTLLNLVYRSGYQAALGVESSSESSAIRNSDPSRSSAVESATAFRSKVDSDENNILKLDNGAVVEISSGYVGYVRNRKDAVLFKRGNGWRIWVEGKRAYPCDLLKEPIHGRASTAELVYVSEVKGDGALLVLDDGSLLEVDSLSTLITSLWLGLFEAILLDGNQLINLDNGDESISITRLRE